MTKSPATQNQNPWDVSDELLNVYSSSDGKLKVLSKLKRYEFLSQAGYQ